MIVQASIPDFLIRQVEEVARREGTTVDSIIAISPSHPNSPHGKSATPSNNAPPAETPPTWKKFYPTSRTLLPHPAMNGNKRL
jgi:hypothetical protein